METRWLYTTSENFDALRELSCDTCVLPMGCVEKHGLHLPLGVDVFEAERLAYEASKLEPVCVFPTFCFGDVPDNSPNFAPGSITLPLETQMLLLEQMCEQIARNGFKKIVIYNSHGGNTPWLTTFLRKIDCDYHDFVLMFVNMKSRFLAEMSQNIRTQGPSAYPEMNEEDIQYVLQCADENIISGHAGFGESAFTIGLEPETVHLERLGVVNGFSLNLTSQYAEAGISIKDGGWSINHPHAMHGHDPVGLNERIGKACVRHEAERVAKAIKLIKEDTNLIKWHNQRWNSNL